MGASGSPRHGGLMRGSPIYWNPLWEETLTKKILKCYNLDVSSEELTTGRCPSEAGYTAYAGAER